MVIVAKEVIKTSDRDFILKTFGEVRYAQLIYNENDPADSVSVVIITRLSLRWLDSYLSLNHVEASFLFV